MRPNILLEALAHVRDGNPTVAADAAAGMIDSLLAFASATPDNLAAADLVHYDPYKGFVQTSSHEPLGNLLLRTRWIQAEDPALVANCVDVGRIALALASPSARHTVYDLLFEVASSEDCPSGELRTRVRDAICSEGQRLIGVRLPESCGFEVVETSRWQRAGLAFELSSGRVRASDLLNQLDPGDSVIGAAAQRIAVIVCIAFGASWYSGSALDDVRDADVDEESSAC